MTVWSARTGANLDAAFQAFSSSIVEDEAFLQHDIAGSIAHVRGLQHVGLLTTDESAQLVEGLQGIRSLAEAGQFPLNPELEDVHMNIEAHLTQTLGDVGLKLHTGRSRNDQVATCIVLFARDHCALLAASCLHVAQALHQLAEANLHTPWVARTHGQPAQPATIGFLLTAHAWRFSAAAQQLLWTANHIAISPLGSGAIAGSTLPLDPAFTANLLGLRPPRNALVATGTRDTVTTVLQATTRLAHVTSSLAQDLFELSTKGAIQFAPGLTTGSSLMPQKRNPDAIELVRGQARSLIGHEAAVQAITLPLGLGYVRDLQLVKPHLVQACRGANAMLEILHAAVASATFDAHMLGKEFQLPGIGATDAAEALVAHGMPFRTAYTLIAEAHKEGNDPATFIAAIEAPANAVHAALGALHADAAPRDTLGGPAPVAVKASLDALAAALNTQTAEANAILNPTLAAPSVKVHA